MRENDVGVREARRRFGGLDIPATLVGALTALAVLVLLGGLIGAAVGAIGYQVGLKGAAGELSIGGLLGGLIALFVAFLIGGWAAGRIARFDGGRNGLVTAIWPILLAGLLALLGVLFGEKYNVFQQVNNLPQPFSRDALTVGAIVSGLVALAVMLIAGFLGGKWGARYHARVDEEIARTDEGGLVTGRR